MSDFDQLRRAAEKHFGPDVVKNIEKEIQKRTNRDDKLEQLVSVERVTFDGESKSDLDQLRRAAEKHFEPDTVKKVEKGIGRRANRNDKTKTNNSRVKKQLNSASVVNKETRVEPIDQQSKSTSSNSSSERILSEAIKGEYSYAKLGLILGLASIVGGVILGLNGVAGATSWSAKLLGLESNLNDAAPGVVLFIVGIFFIQITKPKVSLKDLNG